MNSIKNVFFAFILTITLTSCASQGGHMAANDAKYSAESSSQMGVRYLLGRGVPQDNSKAFYYFSQAAQAGDPFAQNELGYLYAAGKGTAHNNEEAFKWYGKAAEQGLASAQYNYGLMYYYGIGTPVNRIEAMKWINKSAERGFEPAKQKLHIG